MYKSEQIRKFWTSSHGRFFQSKKYLTAVNLFYLFIAIVPFQTKQTGSNYNFHTEIAKKIHKLNLG